MLGLVDVGERQRQALQGIGYPSDCLLAGEGVGFSLLRMRIVTSILLTCCLSACMSANHTLPDARDMDEYFIAAMGVAKPEFDALERERAAGTITQAAYEARKAEMEASVAARASDAAWTRHALAESQRKMAGIPTPDAPQDIPVPQAGSGQGGISQGSYRRFNEQDQGYSATGPIQRDFFRGYSPGSAIRGSP